MCSLPTSLKGILCFRQKDKNIFGANRAPPFMYRLLNFYHVGDIADMDIVTYLARVSCAGMKAWTSLIPTK